jgi:transposase
VLGVLGVELVDAARVGPAADVDAGDKPGLTSDERNELVELRREKRRLEMENGILKRAAAYLRARGHPPKMIYPVVRELAVDGSRSRWPAGS